MAKVIKIDHSNVKKLEGSRNFPLWKLTLENLFWAAGLEQVVFGNETRPASDADKQKLWDVNNRAGMGIILQTVDEKLTSYIFSCDTAAAMWTAMNQTFGKSNKWTKQQLLQEFYQANLGEQTPAELVNNLQNISGQLSATGYKSLDEDAILSKVLHELRGPRFDSFVSSWDVVADKEKTIVNLVQKLKIHESREESWNKDEVPENFSGVKPGGADYKQKGKVTSAPENGKGKKPGRCFNCGVRGHFKADCRSPKKEKKTVAAGESKEVKDTPTDKSKSFSGTTDKAFMVKSYKAQALKDPFVWFCDSGTNVHICGRKEWFTSYVKFDLPIKLQVATNSFAECPGEGNVVVQACIKNKWEVVTITKVLFLPQGANLFSQNCMLKKGFSAQSSSDGTIFYGQDGKESLRARLNEEGMQIMIFKPVEKLPKALLCASEKLVQQRWHERLGHVNFKYLQNSLSKNAVFLGPRDKLEKEYRCEICIKAKATLKPCRTQNNKNHETGELLHFDLVHAVTQSNQGNKYFLLIKDDGSNYRVAYFQKTKEAETTVSNIMDAVEMFSNQTGKGVKRLKSDQGTEFKNRIMNTFISEKGIIYDYTSAGCSQSNGKIERDVRTIRNTARALLFEVGLSPAFWQDAVATAIYTLNRLLSSTNKDKTPYELLFGRKPNLSHARIFGCAASARILTPKGDWTTRTREGIFVGHIPDTREYKLWDSEKREYFLSRHVDFFEEAIPPRPSPHDTGKMIFEEEKEIKESLSSVKSVAVPETQNDDDDVLEIHADGRFQVESESSVSSWAEQMEEISADEEDDFHDAQRLDSQIGSPEGSQIEESDDQETSDDESNDVNSPTPTTTGNRRSQRTNQGLLPKRYARAVPRNCQAWYELKCRALS
ncbi:Copia protein [Folsomia candida]|uniref:Copia protein n=1 Tax=Folsomia candida TaxID=158441 RepID=A0A226D5B4_FOLCA|nr:Copia protein [Folsomia candida]